MSQTKKFVLDLSGNYTSEVLYEMYSFGFLGLLLKCCLKIPDDLLYQKYNCWAKTFCLFISFV